MKKSVRIKMVRAMETIARCVNDSEFLEKYLELDPKFEEVIE